MDDSIYGFTFKFDYASYQFQVGKFTVRNVPHFEHPCRPSQWRLYEVFLDGEFLGRQLSYPNEEQCRDWFYRAKPHGILIQRRPFVGFFRPTGGALTKPHMSGSSGGHS